jgi:hypothetical protein
MAIFRPGHQRVNVFPYYYYLFYVVLEFCYSSLYIHRAVNISPARALSNAFLYLWSVNSYNILSLFQFL